MNGSEKLRRFTEPPAAFGRGIKILTGVSLILAYLMLALFLWQGWLPATVTWAGLVLVPAIWFLALGSVLFFPVKTSRQRWTWFTFSMICCAVGCGAVYWQGWV